MPRYTVQVKPNAKQPNVIAISDRELRVAVNAPAAEGKANRRLIEILAGYFGVAKSRIKILRGETGRIKIIEI